jgi:hypothetical protein
MPPTSPCCQGWPLHTEFNKVAQIRNASSHFPACPHQEPRSPRPPITPHHTKAADIRASHVQTSTQAVKLPNAQLGQARAKATQAHVAQQACRGGLGSSCACMSQQAPRTLSPTTTPLALPRPPAHRAEQGRGAPVVARRARAALLLSPLVLRHSWQGVQQGGRQAAAGAAAATPAQRRCRSGQGVAACCHPLAARALPCALGLRGGGRGRRFRRRCATCCPACSCVGGGRPLPVRSRWRSHPAVLLPRSQRRA